MLPKDIATEAIRAKIETCPEITAFTLEPAAIPGLAPLLAVEIAELTPELAEEIGRIYLSCLEEVPLCGYRVGTLPAVLGLGAD